MAKSPPSTNVKIKHQLIHAFEMPFGTGIVPDLGAGATAQLVVFQYRELGLVGIHAQ